MRVIAIVNQKGGCGKTTTTVNLAGCLAADGARVLVVDMDPAGARDARARHRSRERSTRTSTRCWPTRTAPAGCEA